MSTPEFSEEFQPYINEEFWSGHMLGDNDAKPFERAAYDLKSVRFAKQALEERLLQMRSLMPLETFSPGTTFSAKNYNPGTVVLLREHKLTNVAPSSVMDPQPEPAMDLNLRPGEGFSRFLSENGVAYANAVRWGVVAETKRGKPALITFGAGMVHKLASDKVQILGGYGIQPRIAIGNTAHEAGRGRELLSKINLLYVCGYGKPKKIRVPLAERLGDLVFKPAVT